MQHFNDVHKRKITRHEIEEEISIRYKERNVYRLNILESLIINKEDPNLNKQDTGRHLILKLYGSSICKK